MADGRVAGQCTTAAGRRATSRYSLAWLARVLPVVRSADQLVVAHAALPGVPRCDGATLLLCPMASCGNSASAATTKYRALVELREAGVIAIEEAEHQALGAGDLALVPVSGPMSTRRTRVGLLNKRRKKERKQESKETRFQEK